MAVDRRRSNGKFDIGERFHIQTRQIYGPAKTNDRPSGSILLIIELVFRVIRFDSARTNETLIIYALFIITGPAYPGLSSFFQ